jgi:hypothetical protein
MTIIHLSTYPSDINRSNSGRHFSLCINWRFLVFSLTSWIGLPKFIKLRCKLCRPTTWVNSESMYILITSHIYVFVIILRMNSYFPSKRSRPSMGLTRPFLNSYTQHCTGVKCRGAKLNEEVMESVTQPRLRHTPSCRSQWLDLTITNCLVFQWCHRM